MAAAIGVRTDHTARDLRRLARRCGDPDQVRRLLAMALILDGGSRIDAAKVAGVTLEIVRDWVLRFSAEGPDGLATRKAPGRASILNDEQRARLAPSNYGDPATASNDLLVHTEFGADAWTFVHWAGFSSLALHQIDFPSAIAISAWNDPQVEHPSS